MTSHISARTLALRTGLHIDTVRAACARGLVEMNGQGRYPVEAAEAACREHVDVPMVEGHATSGRGNVEAHQLGGLGNGSGGSTFGTLAAAKRDEAVTRAEARRFDLDVKRGKYLPREDVLSAGADVIRRATFHFLRLGERAAPRLVGMTDPAAISAVLEEEARASLAELSDLGRVVEDLLG